MSPCRPLRGGSNVQRLGGLVLVAGSSLLVMFVASSCERETPSGQIGNAAFRQRQSLTSTTPSRQLGEDCSAFPNGSSCLPVAGAITVCLHYGPRGFPNSDYVCSRSCTTHFDCPAQFMCQQILPGEQDSYVCVPPINWTPAVASPRDGGPGDWPNVPLPNGGSPTWGQ
jgi:hypothetical protein